MTPIRRPEQHYTTAHHGYGRGGEGARGGRGKGQDRIYGALVNYLGSR